jgi:hypothetical protein
MTWRDRYQQAHRTFQSKEYPSSYRDFGPIDTQFPKVSTSNGLTNMICKFLNWSGHRATRINVQGRMIEGTEKQESGTVLTC